MENEYCTFCNMSVASADPDREVYEDMVFHGRCIVKTKKEIEQIISTMSLFLLANKSLHMILRRWDVAVKSGECHDRQGLIEALTDCFRHMESWRKCKDREQDLNKNKSDNIELSPLAIDGMKLHFSRRLKHKF